MDCCCFVERRGGGGGGWGGWGGTPHPGTKTEILGIVLRDEGPVGEVCLPARFAWKECREVGR